MRSFWSRIRPIGCHCHCYSCIENRHILVRRLSVAIARFRCGRGFPSLLFDSTRSPPRKTWAIEQRRLFRSVPGSKITEQQNKKQSATSREQELPESLREEHTSVDHETSLHRDSLIERNQLSAERREKELEEAANELRSLSIDHWSLEDVVTYEPMPGGAIPPTVPSTTTADTNFMMPQSPWASDHLKRQNYARVWTRKKIAKMETAVALFTVRVCRLLELDSQRPSNLLVLPEAMRPFAKLPAKHHDYLELAFKRHLDTLRNKHGFVPPHDPPNTPDEIEMFMPKYEHFEDGLHHELLRDLNTSLVELFQGYRGQDLDFRTLMVKICHNLLVSSAPPNVQTMNILLLGFYSCDRYLRLSASHVRHLILDWLIHICRTVMIRPNEITCSTILATYRKRGMRDSFVDFIFLMRGMGGDRALMYTRDLTLTRESAPRLSPTESSSTIFKQAVYPSPMIFAEVIKGVAKFYTLEDAVNICKDFTAKEWGYDWKCLHYLLNACILRKDWQSGLWVWEEIKAFRRAGYEEPIRILAAMLALCVHCQQEKMFAEVLAYSTSQLKKISTPAFVDMATEILERAVDRMDDDELSAFDYSSTDGESGDRLHEKRSFEDSVRRILKDDPSFRRAVFGIGYAARSDQEKWSSFASAPELDPDYSFRSLELRQKIMDVEAANERLHVEEEQEERNWSPIDDHSIQSHLRDAEGGADVEEDANRSLSSVQPGKNK